MKIRGINPVQISADQRAAAQLGRPVEVRAIPVADGGEGTLDAVRAARGGEEVLCSVRGPLGGAVDATYLRTTDASGAPIAVVEMARAAGLSLTSRTEADALAASTAGVGALVRAAVEAGKHIFVEKPACVDPVQARELFEIADLADKKGLTIIPGVQRRFHPGYMEAIKRLQDGQIGEIVAVQAYWLNSRFFIQDGGKLRLQNPDPMQIEYQIRNWFIFRWTSGDCYVEQHVHNLDVVRWALGKDPVEVNGIGGRRWDIPYPQYGDRFSHFGVDFDFGNGLHCASYSRREQKSKDYVLERFVGTKGILETNENNMQRITGAKPWEAPKGLPHALIEEHRVLIDSVLNNKKINMLREMVDSTLMAIAGRESCYSGTNFKYGWIKQKSQLSLAPKEWKFGVHDIDPIPLPGEYKLS